MHKLHIGSQVIQQVEIDGHHHDLVAFVTELPHEGADPDKVKLVVLSPFTSSENLLAHGVNFGIVSQHGDKHGTFRYADE